MAAGRGFSFSLEGIEVVVGELDAFDDELDKRLEKKLLDLANQVIYTAKRLAPNLSGDLEGALNVGEVMQLLGMMYIDIGASPEVDHYAVVQHEGFMHRNGKLIPLTPGEHTLSKGPYNGEMPGAKFLERALKMNEKQIIEELSTILEG